jgi:hypothetical protein
VYLQLTRNITAVGDYGINRNEQVVGNLLVRHALHQTYNNVFLAVGKRITIVAPTFKHHRRNIPRHVVLL